ncbi:MAG: alanine racemase [Planctomycetota bacterium]
MTVEARLDSRCRLENADEVFTPALVVFPDLIRENLKAAIRMAGDARRMRPHVKTHKTIELTKMMFEEGITKVKCATFAEAEVVADAGAKDVVFAYSLVGPNIQRFVQLQARYPNCSFKPLVDHPEPLAALARAVTAAGQTAEVLLDLDVGMGRTGVPIGPEARSLYEKIAHAGDRAWRTACLRRSKSSGESRGTFRRRPQGLGLGARVRRLPGGRGSKHTSTGMWQ